MNLQKTTSTFKRTSDRKSRSPEENIPEENEEESEDDMKTPEHDPLAGLHEEPNEDLNGEDELEEIEGENDLEDGIEAGEDALLYSPVDPIANLPFITDFVPDYVPERVTIPDEEIQEIVFDKLLWSLIDF